MDRGSNTRFCTVFGCEEGMFVSMALPSVLLDDDDNDGDADEVFGGILSLAASIAASVKQEMEGMETSLVPYDGLESPLLSPLLPLPTPPA